MTEESVITEAPWGALQKLIDAGETKPVRDFVENLSSDEQRRVVARLSLDERESLVALLGADDGADAAAAGFGLDLGPSLGRTA